MIKKEMNKIPDSFGQCHLPPPLVKRMAEEETISRGDWQQDHLTEGTASQTSPPNSPLSSAHTVQWNPRNLLSAQDPPCLNGTL